MRTLLLALAIVSAAHGQAIEWWLTTEDGAHQLQTMPTLEFEDGRVPRKTTTIRIDTDRQYQTILGLGASFDHATCYNLSRLEEPKRNDVLTRIVDPEKGIGMNLMRVCMGTPDFTGEPWYSYCDVPEGETDPDLTHFSIEKDRAYILPILKRALEINPDLLYFASPWSPPAWMKTNGSMLAGKLKPEWYSAFAQYFVKFIQAYEAEGIPIHAVTIQNEPDFPNPEYPTCHWTGAEQRDFIRDHLGPAFKAAGIKTRIWCWDHNWNLLEFPTAILSDPAAAQYVDGTGFHLYEGKVDAQTTLHEAFPEKHIYFTEGSVFGTRGSALMVDILRNWSRSYNAWVIMLDAQRGPNNGPHSASQTSIELLADGNVAYNRDYFLYGQFMKFIPRGAVRIESGSESDAISHVAFTDPASGSLVVIAVNRGRSEAKLAIASKSGHALVALPARATATFRWLPES